MWPHQGEHPERAVPAQPAIQVPGDRRQQDRGQRAPGQRANPGHRGRGQPRHVTPTPCSQSSTSYIISNLPANYSSGSRGYLCYERINNLFYLTSNLYVLFQEFVESVSAQKWEGKKS